MKVTTLQDQWSASSSLTSCKLYIVKSKTGVMGEVPND